MTPDERRAAIERCDRQMRRLFEERGSDPIVRAETQQWLDEHASVLRSIHDPETREAWLAYVDAWRRRWAEA